MQSGLRSSTDRCLSSKDWSVKKKCTLSPFLFLLVIDWVLKTSTGHKGNGIQWTPLTQLDDLDFADYLPHTQCQVQEKTSTIADNSVRLGLKVHGDKRKALKNNSAVSATTLALDGDALEEMTLRFFCLGNVVYKQSVCVCWEGGGAYFDVKVRIGRARATFL